jgi:hypothetical protein
MTATSPAQKSASEMIPARLLRLAAPRNPAADAELRDVRLERALAQPIGGQNSVEPGASSSRGRTGRRLLEQRAPLPRVRGKQRCPLELGPGLVEPA